jgi:hypothetical protein
MSDPDPEPPAADRLIRRAYSIASSSKATAYLEFFITLVRSGGLTPRLFALEPGDHVWLGPRITGTFTLDAAPADRDVVMVATGTGLAPYMSMLRTVLHDEPHRRFRGHPRRPPLVGSGLPRGTRDHGEAFGRFHLPAGDLAPGSGAGAVARADRVCHQRLGFG